MNISFSPQRRICFKIFSYGSNANSPKNSHDHTKKIEKNNVLNKKNVSKPLGGQFKRNSILESLMKQKENLMDNKNTIIERSLKKGEDARAIKGKLESIDKQILKIDKQVNELLLEEQRKSIGTENKNKKDKNSTQQSNKDYPNDMKTDPSLDNILNLSTDLTKTKSLSSQKNLMSAEARVLAFEIELDEKRGLDPVWKKKYLAKMEDKIENITEKLSNHLKDINTKISNKTQNNSSNNIVDKNKDNKDSSIHSTPKDENKFLIKQNLLAQNIKHYKDIIKDRNKNNNNKINIIV